MSKLPNLVVQDQSIQVKQVSDATYLSLTDIARIWMIGKEMNSTVNQLNNSESFEQFVLELKKAFAKRNMAYCKRLIKN
jgi:hypothetical protein